MDDKIYESPKSNVAVSREFIANQNLLLGVFDKNMIIAIVILITLALAISISSFLNQTNMSIENVTLGLALEIFWAIFLVYMIQLLGGSRKISKKHPSVYEKRGAFGYLWRTLIVKYLSLFVIVLLLTLFSLASRIEAPSALYTLVSFGLSIIASVFVIWLLFSKDRAGQFKWVIAIFRRY